jgi:hypothetical protein
MLMPLLVILILGVWELGRFIQITQLISNAAREGARQGASAKYTIEEVRQATFEYLKSSGVPCHNTLASADVTLSNTNVIIEVVNFDGPETYNAEQFDRIHVTVRVPMVNFHWLTTNNFLPVGTMASAEAAFLCVKDLPIVVPTSIPQRPLE